MGHQETISPDRVILLAISVLVVGLIACGLVTGTMGITFTADRTSIVAGECTTLRWHVPDDDNVALDGQPINPSGQMDVCPTDTTTYHIRVGIGDDARQQEITIVVEGGTDFPTSITPESPLSTETPTSTPTRTSTSTRTPPPALSFTFSPTSGPAGSDVELYLSSPVPVDVYYEGRVLPKVVLAGGSTLRVTIPGSASSGYFELRWDGQSVRATVQFTVTPTSTTVTLNNNSGQMVCYVYISPSDQAIWGDDWLGGAEIIYSGSNYVFYVRVDTYDLKAEDCNHTAIDTRWDVNLSISYIWDIGP
ncbi:MAG: hypothetical protein PVI78_03665 [Anaerolineales bacterium]